MRHLAAVLAAFLGGFVLPWALTAIQPPAEPGYPYAVLAASFILNLACLAFAVARLPMRESVERNRFGAHFRAFAVTLPIVAAAHVGMWLAPGHSESIGTFATLALLCAAQCSALFATHAMLIVFCKGRWARAVIVLGLALLTTALFWTREPIQRMSKADGAWPEYAPRVADGVMKLSPPAAVASAWHEESDAARGKIGAGARRFVLVQGRLTYAIWIGSYQVVAVPDVLPKGLSSDFYARTEFSPGIVLFLLAWALPLMVLCDFLLSRNEYDIECSFRPERPK